ncbi:hypothetical protein V6N13_088049 [Hibiscus sabdariffa]|uniref:Uncharacterized protein n=1 Tax=Hibiscus sabdariffa TaxID=183260 RepID=A0ABR2FZ02_9ROSI
MLEMGTLFLYPASRPYTGLAEASLPGCGPIQRDGHNTKQGVVWRGVGTGSKAGLRIRKGKENRPPAKSTLSDWLPPSLGLGTTSSLGIGADVQPPITDPMIPLEATVNSGSRLGHDSAGIHRNYV